MDVGELVHHTGLTELEVIDALYELEREGRARPFMTNAGEARERSR